MTGEMGADDADDPLTDGLSGPPPTRRTGCHPPNSACLNPPREYKVVACSVTASVATDNQMIVNSASIATVGGFTMISRFLGFARDILIAAILGAGPVADRFRRVQTADFFRRLFAEGALTLHSCRCLRGTCRRRA